MKVQDASMLYKLIVLYLLKTAGYPLTNSDISDYVLIKGYTDAITLQIAITDLENDNMIVSDKKHNRTYYSLTSEGENTVMLLDDRLSLNLKNDIYSYIALNDKKLKNEHSIQKKVIESSNGEYIAQLIAKDNNGELMNIQITFPSQTLANSACDKFEEASSDIYKYILSKLMS